tara:strand:+ start:193374 stop:193889 length:516 start_codon:yes stop_codon:yes gene_type:complete
MEKDLKHIINKSTGFKTPPSYFDALEDHIMNRIKLEEDAIKKNPFTAPDHYFDSLEETISKKTTQNTAGKPKIISLKNHNFIKYAASIAAIFLLVFSVYHFQNTSNVNNESDFTSVTDYIEDNVIDISTYDLQELLSDEFTENGFPESDITQEELLEYLSYNIDETAFLNE